MSPRRERRAEQKAALIASTRGLAPIVVPAEGGTLTVAEALLKVLKDAREKNGRKAIWVEVGIWFEASLTTRSFGPASITAIEVSRH